DGYVHAGVQATMVDRTAGAAAGALIARGQLRLTVEFKINLLRPGRAAPLRSAGPDLRGRRDPGRPG
ncbi:MAG TPA: hotdog domain-containing protein, partial [Rubrobacteraceae bacterium]|nr:hotdog domain-containing protein [Rubrobacteraceae bacterium]